MNELFLVPGGLELTGIEPLIFFGLFGFLKKIKNTVKKIGGLALNFVPGGGIIKSGLGVATAGIGAIVRATKGTPRASVGIGIGQPVFTAPTTFTQPTTGSAAFNFPGQSGLIFGMPKTTAFAIGGLLLAAAVFFMSKKG